MNRSFHWVASLAVELFSMIFAAALCGFATKAHALDDDADGLSDVWQRTYRVASGAKNADLDSDGFTNEQECAMGTNPNLPGLRATITEPFSPLTPVTTADGARVQWKTARGIRYQLEQTTDLQTYTSVGQLVNGDGSVVTTPVSELPLAAGALFVRLKALPPIDQDGDGLNAYEEALLGTSDSRADSDGDLVPDATEFRQHLNPASSASNDGDTIPDDWEVFHFGNNGALTGADADSDGFTNLDEFTFDLDPSVNDFGAGGVVTQIYTYDAANRLTGVDSVLDESFTYDAEGNLTNSH